MDNPFKVTPKKRSVKIKKKTGIIYSNPTGWKRIFFYLGTVIILVAVAYLVYLYQPLAYSWLTYENNFKGKKLDIIVNEKPTETQNNQFDIRIPRIGAQSNIVANVSPYNPDEYLKVLENNLIAQSKTSSTPGNGKGTATYLFAHSSQQNLQMVRNNSVFYLLGELNNEDVVLINYKGKNYMYKVYMKKIVGAKEAEYLNYIDKDKEIIILQTCWPIGTNWKRLLVFAERV